MRTCHFLIALVLALSVPASAQPPTADLDRAVLRAELGRFWGAVLVQRRGEVLLAKGYGYANEQLAPIGPDSLFDVGSVAKMFTAAAVLRLEQEGRLALSDPLSTFFPDAPPAAKDITLHHLLSHTSGKSDREGAIQPLNFQDRDRAVELFLRSRSANRPGEAFEYCNGGYVVLAAVIEVVTKQPLEQAMRRLVLAPAKLDHSGFLDGEGLDPTKQTTRLISGPPSRRGLMLDKRVEPWAWGLRGAGGLCTSLDDLRAWEHAIRTHAVLNEAQTAKWFTPVKSGYALGWQVGTDDQGRRTLRHGGATRGYRCDLLRYPDDEVLIAVLTGDSSNPATIADALAKVIFPPEPSSTHAQITVKGEKLNAYRAALYDAGLTLTSSRVEGRPRLTLAHHNPARTLATFTLDPAAAGKLARSILATLDGGEHVAAEGGIKAGVYLYQYPAAAAAGSLIIDNAAWTVMPGYRGRGEKGEAIRDDRLVLVLTDPALEGVWPVMIHIDDETARRLAADLQSQGLP
jgi:CubicO group peptidase (beta-lactamase class C family)